MERKKIIYTITFTIFLMILFAIKYPFTTNEIIGGYGYPSPPSYSCSPSNCSGGFCSDHSWCRYYCSNNVCTYSCSCSAGKCGVQCCSDSDCGGSGSCNYRWENVGCGQGGCSAGQMYQIGTPGNSSYTRYYCSSRQCRSETVNCSQATRCVNSNACAISITIRHNTPSANYVYVGETETTNVYFDANLNTYAVCEDSWSIKIDGQNKGGWNVSGSGTFTMSDCSGPYPPNCSAYSLGYEQCWDYADQQYYSVQARYFYRHKTFSQSFQFQAPGVYNFSATGRFIDYINNTYTTSTPTTTPLLVKARYGETVSGKPTDVSVSEDVYLGFDGASTAVESGAVLGSNGKVTIRGTLNLAANADKNKPIRIIYGTELSFAPGAQIILPSPGSSNFGGAYIIKKGTYDSSISSNASLCSYRSTRPYKYCDIKKICDDWGLCASYNP